MLLLITGASGMGKSSVRGLLAPALEPEVECVELGGVVTVPAWPDLAWRQRATEAGVQRALEREAEGRHLLLAGDPVAPGEVMAAPSAHRLGAVRACLLDASAERQEERLRGRGDPDALFPDHVAFATWMRAHAEDPSHMPQVLTGGGWKEMRWERWIGRPRADLTWDIVRIDTSELTVEEVAAETLAWVRAALRGETRALACP